MDWATATMALAALGGGATMLLGIMVALNRPLRTFTGMLAGFLFVWGLSSVLGGLWRWQFLDGNAEAAATTVQVVCALLAALVFLVLAFASIYPPRERQSGLPLRLMASALPSVLLLTFLIAHPSTFTGGLADGSLRLGPMYYVTTLVVLGGGLYALWSMDRFGRAAKLHIDQQRSQGVAFALVLILGNLGADALTASLSSRVITGSNGDWSLAAYGIAGLLTLLLCARVVATWPDRAENLLAIRRPILAMWAAAAAATGVLAGLARSALIPTPIETKPVWQFFAAILMAYSILKFRSLDFAQRLRRSGFALGIWLTFVVLSVASISLLGELTASVLLAQSAWAGLVGLGVAFVALRSRYSEVSDLESPAKLEAQTLELYEAKVVNQVRRQGHASLDGLAEELQLTPDQQDAVRAMAIPSSSPSQPVPWQVGDVVRGRCQIDVQLGPRTYRGWDNLLVRLVVLKFHPLSDSASLRRLLTEARLMARIRHPNLVQVHDFGFDRFPFMVMEFVNGPSLESRVMESGPLSPHDTIDVLLPTLDALRVLHDASILHGDLKPANILLDARGPKICDFGLSALASRNDGRVLGSPAFMSPEAAAGQPLKASSDLYSVGALAHYLVTGRPCLDLPERWEEAQHAILTREPARLPSSLPRQLSSFIEACLQKDPRMRPRSAAEASSYFTEGLHESRNRSSVRPARTTSPRRSGASPPRGSGPQLR